jgi:chromosome segregation ATPase
MEVIKRKITALKSELEEKEEATQTLRQQVKIEQIEREKLDNEVSNLQRKIQLLEENLDRSEDTLADTSRQLEVTEAAKDELERQLRSVENQESLAADKLDNQDFELKTAKQNAHEAEAKYEDAMRKLSVLEGDLERVEFKCDGFQARVAQLESENVQLSTSLKSYEAGEEQSADRETRLEEQLQHLTVASGNNDREIVELTSENKKLLGVVDSLEDQIQRLEAERDEAKASLENVMRELGELA